VTSYFPLAFKEERYEWGSYDSKYYGNNGGNFGYCGSISVAFTFSKKPYSLTSILADN
jgi:hypothetical protein